jgi:RNA polymerase sigma-70 factor (ECF subfamily)
MNRQVFEARVLPHLDAGYNLARWLLRDVQAAEDAVQEAALRAFRHAHTLHDGDARPWWLAIVRNTCFTALARRRQGRLNHDEVDFDEVEFEATLASGQAAATDPAAQLQRTHTRQRIDAAIAALSPPLREVILLRELEDLDYAAIAAITGVPIGTVMSRLSRARARLRSALARDHLGD